MDISNFGLIVGKIDMLAIHEEDSALYVLKVDVGEDKGPRTILSNLTKYISPADLQDKRVVVVSNIEPMKIKGIRTQGMILCAIRRTDPNSSNYEAMELLTPSAHSIPGDTITCGQEGGSTYREEDQCPKFHLRNDAEVLSQIMRDLWVNSQGEATYKGNLLKTSNGDVCKTKTLKQCEIYP
jgi:aminoacyl tRNA synthase complex-interacting multifunctional protein 1